MISGFNMPNVPKLTSKVTILLSVIIIIIMYRCIFPYEPVIDKYENVLVVDGLLTNIQGNCFVKLSRTYRYDEKPDSVEIGASVLIMDDQGNQMKLKDNGNGLYLPEDSTFSGVIGRKYKVSVETQGGEICESSLDELKEPVDIEEVYYTYKDMGKEIKGLQFYVDAYDHQHRSHYYSWDFEETWEFSVPYQSMSDYLPEMKVCYRHNSSRKISIASTMEFSEDRIIGFPLFFIDNTTNRLAVKYSVVVRQYVLTEKTYEFYNDLKEINENTGTLFDRTPVILAGNLINTIDPGKPVLGNFQVSGASEKRIFIHRDDLPADMTIVTEYEYCKADLVSKITQRSKLDSLLRIGWTVMDTIYDETEHDTLIGLAISRSCFDCTMKGDIVMPDYWTEK
jgi:hypothetical protein